MKSVLNALLVLACSSSAFASGYRCTASVDHTTRALTAASPTLMTTEIGIYQFAVTQITKTELALAVVHLDKKEKIAFSSGFGLPSAGKDVSSVLFLATGESVMLSCRAE